MGWHRVEQLHRDHSTFGRLALVGDMSLCYSSVDDWPYWVISSYSIFSRQRSQGGGPPPTVRQPQYVQAMAFQNEIVHKTLNQVAQY